MKRKAYKTPWHLTEAAAPSYRIARAEAQAKANEFGYDYGIEGNDLFRSWHVFMLPGKGSRFGHELRCEVVSCMQLDRCKPGHGPGAT
jgi:hypothetical protein